MWLSDDGRRILQYQFEFNETSLRFGVVHQPDARKPYRAFDSSTGDLITSYDPVGNEVALIPDHALLIVREKSQSETTYSLIDLMSRDRMPMVWPGSFESEVCAARAIVDGRFVVLVSCRACRYETIWWHRSARTARVFPGIEPLAMAADGRWLTRGDTPSDVCIREPNSDAVRCRIAVDGSFTTAKFSRDNTCLFVGQGKWLGGPKGDVFETEPAATWLP
jgi:hypothetical protein